MNEKRYNADEVRASARDRWDMILHHLAPEIEAAISSRGKKHIACPVHGGKDGFRVFKDVAETGGGVCNTCGKFHDGFSLLMWLRGWSFVETLRAVGGLLGTGEIPSITERKPEPKAPERRDPQKRLITTWQESLPITDHSATSLFRYFESRGIPISSWLHMVPNHEALLRFHPSLTYYEEGELVGRFPALLALVTKNDGRPVTIHRHWIAKDGSGKAPVAEPRKLMTPYAGLRTPGSAIQIGKPSNGIYQVAEGLETALSIMVARHKPVWSAISDTFLESFDPPPDASMIIIWSDKDRPSIKTGIEPGQAAAEKLRKRMEDAGYRTRVFIPPKEIPNGKKSVDWNDILVEDGPEYIGPQKKAKRGFLQSVADLWRVA